ncbi:hypothetical protein B296_00029016 [Ensete ventricosum]|uniref:Uncharacterized protein n=1 Tax=Ensete ventricosum TaxID=4639 RepID=A0A426YZW3_ENSVE|nr:hypothetical protein B296_00029016 [Ensete ventricosum]
MGPADWARDITGGAAFSGISRGQRARRIWSYTRDSTGNDIVHLPDSCSLGGPAYSTGAITREARSRG